MNDEIWHLNTWVDATWTDLNGDTMSSFKNLQILISAQDKKEALEQAEKLIEKLKNGDFDLLKKNFNFDNPKSKIKIKCEKSQLCFVKNL